MRETIREAILGTVKDLHHSGLVDETTVARMDSLCMKDYPPAAITQLRHRYHLTPTKFAQLLNISPSTVRNWEAGINKPRGAALRLLSLLDNSRGLDFG
jgi:putative transcriptional regulator